MSPFAPNDLASLRERLAALPFDDGELSYLATSVLYGRGSLAKADRRAAVTVIRTMQAILADVRAVEARALLPQNQESTDGR